jgi:hypothetical protein
LQKHLAAYLSVVIIFLVVVSSVAVITPLLDANPQQFYVGVTYCGDSVEEAKQLINRVKGYTNLFVLQSGFITTEKDITEIGDYAINSGLKFLFYYGHSLSGLASDANILAKYAEERWSSNFLGAYYNDEPGGKILDSPRIDIQPIICPDGTAGSLFRDTDGTVSVTSFVNDTMSIRSSFHKSGELEIKEQKILMSYYERWNSSAPADENKLVETIKSINYHPNGTITCSLTETYGTNMVQHSVTTGPFTFQPDGTVQDQKGNIVTDQGDISQFKPYKQLLESNPFKTPAITAATFVGGYQSSLRDAKNNTGTSFFTADYALYWYDYQSGYDTVFAEFVGNESRERHIALCRGAAESFGKDWGAIITWKYNQAPYLESGDELYNDLALAYNSGAKYGIVFTYPNITAYGTLTDEHFEALQRFWNTLKTNPDSLGKTESEVAYVVPADYGSGFRTSNDNLWGQFPADELSAKIYSDIVALTGRYGAKLNILYDGAETAAKLGGYSAVYYYNQTIT